MPTLSSRERGVLERAVLGARSTAERAVRKRFASLDLSSGTAPGGMSAEDHVVRTALRRRAADLGRGRLNVSHGFDQAMEAGIPFLVEELAYDTWHRMLFARFLLESDLLTDPDYGMTLSLDDLTDLAADGGFDRWELAARFAAQRLPGLFHLTMPLRLASEDRQDLTRILEGLEGELFLASDSLGWVYQYWQSQRKDEVNASGQKITGATLPPVTQLFTEDYIVDFLLQTSLGAWYVSRYPETTLKEQWPYLRYREDGTPAAGTFRTWPDSVGQITVMDPCCGSCHFLVAAFPMLVAMRQEQEGLSPEEATDAVLRDNLYGLELDARCTQIASFVLALEAWKLGGHPEEHRPQIACSGIPVAGQKEAWLKLAKGDVNLEIALTNLYEQFSQAAELGSLIDPRRAVSMSGTIKKDQPGFALAHDWGRLEQVLHQALEREEAEDPASRIFAEEDNALVGTVRATQLLSRTYTLVATNVPYLLRRKQSQQMQAYCHSHFPDGREDLATVMLQRCIKLVEKSDDSGKGSTEPGSIAVVTPQNWLSLKAYDDLRRNLLQGVSFLLVAKLGSRAFSSISGEIVNVGMVIMDAATPGSNHSVSGVDVSESSNVVEKAEALKGNKVISVPQCAFSTVPDSRITFYEQSSLPRLSEFAGALLGSSLGDVDSYNRKFWELARLSEEWSKLLNSPVSQAVFGGREHVTLWEQGRGRLASDPGAFIRGKQAWGKVGVFVARTGNLKSVISLGDMHAQNGAVLLPVNPQHLMPIWSYCQSREYTAEVRRISEKIIVASGVLNQVPFDLAHWQRVAEQQYPDGLPEPYSSDPTQWLFDGNVPGADHPLQVAMARLLGYRWPEQAEDGLSSFADPDGIVCLPSVYREPPAHIRLRELLQQTYGETWSDEVLRGFLADVGAQSLEGWLRIKTGFFAQHIKLFYHRPFLWHLTDGRPDGFGAIVNYHRLDVNTLNKLIYTYLGDWIGRQERAVAANETGAQGRLEAATALRARLIAIAEGEPPYDIYVRWKHLAEQPIGWEPDLNDGVRLNIRPFVEAGILASKVNVKWGKDRGADPTVREEPLRSEAGNDLRERIDKHASTERDNDLHFTTAEKRRARELAGVTPGLRAR